MQRINFKVKDLHTSGSPSKSLSLEGHEPVKPVRISNLASSVRPPLLDPILVVYREKNRKDENVTDKVTARSPIHLEMFVLLLTRSYETLHSRVYVGFCIHNTERVEVLDEVLLLEGIFHG